MAKFINKMKDLMFGEYEDDEDYYEDDYEYVDESESESTGRDDSIDSIREGFKKAFGRDPDKPFTAGIKKKLTQVSKRDVLDVIEIARGKHPGNPEAYIMAALSDRGQRAKPQESTPGADDPDRPLEQWEQDWIAEVQRRRAQRGVEQHSISEPGLIRAPFPDICAHCFVPQYLTVSLWDNSGTILLKTLIRW